MKACAGMCWRLPGPFGFAQILGRSYSLRCAVFHNIGAASTPFTAGIRVSVTPEIFENALRFVTANYQPVSLEDVLSHCDGRGLPPRAILLTFDDAYASVAETAAPLCKSYGVPGVFFINAAFVDNRRLAPDNLVCYVADQFGMEAVNSALREVPGWEETAPYSLTQVFGSFFPTLSLDEREIFLEALCQLAGIDESRLAKKANLYVTGRQLRDLKSFGFEIGNHTYSHSHCRSLSHQEALAEIDRNKDELEAISGTRVRSFSQPYGSSKDLTCTIAEHLRQSGHEAVFLSESVANQRDADPFHLDRVSTCADSDEALFFELEILPRLRAGRNWMYRNRRLVRTAKRPSRLVERMATATAGVETTIDQQKHA